MYKGILLGHPLMYECTKFVTRHKPLSHRQWLQRMDQMPEVDLALDFYGEGPVIDILEQKMAKVLGKEKALFVHKGMVGQNSALMQWSHLSGSKHIAIHPQSHIHMDESMAYKELLGLEGVLFGKENAAFDTDDINNLPSQLAAVAIELPVRRAGFKLPSWSDLLDLRTFCDANNIPLHMDGARLLESANYWNKTYAEVAALSDSVYVSLYKTLGAAAGGVIAGDNEFIEQLRPWRTRFGGDMFTAFPYALTALWGLENYLPRISEFNQRAITLSKLIQEKFGEDAIPNPVQCSGFIVELAIDAETLADRALQIAESEKIWFFDRVVETGKNKCKFEMQVGDAMDDWDNVEFIEKLASLLN